MEATVDVSRSDGKMLSDAPRMEAAASTAGFDALQRDADGEVKRIVVANLGRGSTVVARAAQAQPVPAAALASTALTAAH